jgi:RluA family pseudouridine synthase
MNETVERRMKPQEVEARIMFEEGGVLVMDKPAGMPTSGKNLDDDDCLQYWLMRRHASMVWAVHQLDADTSGVNLFVTEKALVPLFHDRLALEETEKRYLAIVEGNPTWSEEVVEAPIGKIDEKSLGVTPEGKGAHSHFRVLSRGEKAALVEARIRTGRTHQIRIHLSHLGHPVLGEEWYRDSPCENHPRQALHAWKLKMEGVDVEVPLAEDLQALMGKEGIEAVPIPPWEF